MEKEHPNNIAFLSLAEKGLVPKGILAVKYRTKKYERTT
jgi:hypothetical protein